MPTSFCHALALVGARTASIEKESPFSAARCSLPPTGAAAAGLRLAGWRGLG